MLGVGNLCLKNNLSSSLTSIRGIRLHIGYADRTRLPVHWKSPFVVRQQELSRRLGDMINDVRSSPEELRRSKANVLLKEYEVLLRQQKNENWFKLEWPTKKKIVWAKLMGTL